MSDENNETKLIEFMRSEIERTQKGVGQTYLFGIIIAVLIAGYMTFVLSMVRQATNGEFLAIAVRQQIEAAAPEMIASGEESLGAQAAVFANDLSDRFLEIVPEIAQVGKESIDSAYQDGVPYISEEFSEMVRLYIRANEAEIREFADTHDSKEFAQEFTREMMDEFARQMDTRMEEATDGEGLAYFNENLATSLLAIDTTLDELLAKSPDELTRRERLQRRILARLVLTVTESNADIAGS